LRPLTHANARQSPIHNQERCFGIPLAYDLRRLAVNSSLLRMNLEAVTRAAASNQWGAIFPELALGSLALLLLVFEMLLPKKDHRYISTISILAQMAILLAVLINFDLPVSTPILSAGSCIKRPPARRCAYFSFSRLSS